MGKINLYRVMSLTLLILFSFASCKGQTDTMENGRGQIEGKVIYGDSYLPYSKVIAYKNNRLIKGTTANSNGQFIFKALPAGSYKIKVVTPNNDVLISRGIIVTEGIAAIAMCDEFFLVDKKKTVRNQIYPDIPLEVTVDSICIYKRKREMMVYHKNKLLKTYHVSLGFTPDGAKHFEGDGKTPEGLYRIQEKNPYSAYHKSLGVSYPNATDINYARKQGKQPGGNIKIHGLPNGDESNKETYLNEDWTWGCISVSNEQIDELYRLVDKQAPILILP